MKSKAKNRILVFGVLIVLALAFIWGNSVLDRGSSGKLSMYITEIIRKIFGEETDFEIIHNCVRKAAHFIEFFMLGLLLELQKNSIEDATEKKYAFFAVFGALASAVIDEYIQFFTGRGSMVPDIVIDFAGSLCAILAVYAFKKNKPE